MDGLPEKITPGSSPTSPQLRPGIVQSKKDVFSNEVLICEDVLFLGSLSVISSDDYAELLATLRQLVKDYEIGLSESTLQPKPAVCLSFPITDESAPFSVFSQQSGEVLQSFNAENVAFYFSTWLKDTQGYVVLTYPDEHPNSNPTAFQKNYYSFVYQCSSMFEARRVVACIGAMVRRTSKPSVSPEIKAVSVLSACPTEYRICFRVYVDMREIDTKSSLGSTSVSKEKPNVFKFRQNLDKILVIGVGQLEDSADIPPLRVVKCPSIGLACGRYINASDVTELAANLVSLTPDQAATLIPEASTFVTIAHWSPHVPQFEILNTVTDRERFVFFTVVFELSLEFVTKPVRISCVFRAKVFQKDAVFWLSSPRTPFCEDVTLFLVEEVNKEENRINMNRFAIAGISSPSSEVICSPTTSTHAEAAKGFPETESASSTSQNLGAAKDLAAPAADAEGVSDDAIDDDEPLMSGNGGEDLRTITNDQLLVAWGALVTEWRARIQSSASSATSLPVPPSAESVVLRSGAEALPDGALGRRVIQLVRRGIPHTMRKEIWQMLAGFQGADPGLTEVYRILLTKPCRFDTEIQRDLPRTFPANDFFKDREGQEVLFQLTRAYALYDEAVGYCQGISFIAAALLLHLPEEQAFCLLAKIMSNYGTRLLFLQNCEGLFRCLHQFECLLRNQLPDVAKAFEDLGVKVHMFASQWFLTLFMTKFPLYLVFRIFDIFLAEGLIFIFKVMISLLRISRSILLSLDFEGTLKYFRVTLPKRFLSREACDQLISMACGAKVSGSRLNRYARDWERIREAEANENSPVVALQREVWQLREQCGRLEKENEGLADNVLSSKTEMQSTIDKLEDRVESLNQELMNVRHELIEKREECALLERDSTKVKDMFREALTKHDEQMTIIAEYKTITANLSRRIEEEASRPSTQLKPSQVFVDVVLACNGTCRRALDERVPGWSSDSAPSNGVIVASELKEGEEMEALRRRVKELELELARNKVNLVDAECARQELSHELMMKTAELEELRNAADAPFTHNARQWLAKKWTTATSRGNGNAAAAPTTAQFVSESSYLFPKFGGSVRLTREELNQPRLLAASQLFLMEGGRKKGSDHDELEGRCHSFGKDWKPYNRLPRVILLVWRPSRYCITHLK
ncbi:Rab GTPase-activating protein 1 [Taenia crassiceps]|uniref:Rab GTPase-activating protein 1 n=1 Tax=Taenia crassiceps TaxID=6207 RepID=A0ABR4QI66_9CEST